jgi:hypothetical protein
LVPPLRLALPITTCDSTSNLTIASPRASADRPLIFFSSTLPLFEASFTAPLPLYCSAALFATRNYEPQPYLTTTTNF